jgi:hypothetical protein
MAQQRRGEPRGDRGVRSLGRAPLGLALSLLLSLACGDPTGPVSGTTLPEGGNAGSSGSSSPSASLVGTWRTVVVVEVPGDLQRWTTTWRFDVEGTCHQTIETESLAEGFPRTTERDCTFATNGSDVTITVNGGGQLTFRFSFADFSPDRLVLDGFEYQRIS